MKVGTGRITKIIMDFLNVEGRYTLITNEVDHKFIMQKVTENNININNLIGKKIKIVDYTFPITAMTIEQTA